MEFKVWGRNKKALAELRLVGSFPVTGARGSCGAALGMPGWILWFGTEKKKALVSYGIVSLVPGVTWVCLSCSFRGAAPTELVVKGEIHSKWEVFSF